MPLDLTRDIADFGNILRSQISRTGVCASTFVEHLWDQTEAAARFVANLPIANEAKKLFVSEVAVKSFEILLAATPLPTWAKAIRWKWVARSIVKVASKAMPSLVERIYSRAVKPTLPQTIHDDTVPAIQEPPL